MVEDLAFFHFFTPGYTDAGAFSVDVYFTGLFSLNPWFVPGLTVEQVNAQLALLIEEPKELELPHNFNVTEFKGYLPAYNALDYIKVGIAQYGGRLVPRSVVFNYQDRLQETLKGIIDAGSLIFEVTTHPTLEITGFPYNAVLLERQPSQSRRHHVLPPA